MTEESIIEQSPAEQSQRYVVHLDAFEGPLDLLLHLIEKRQLEITTISLVAVTDQYLAYLQQWQDEQLPLANMAAFVFIAARLLFIKSQSLLPHNSKEESNAEGETAITMAEELQQHLVEYKLTKEIASVLRQREKSGLQTHARSGLLAGIETQLAWTPPTLTDLSVQKLSRAFQRLLELQVQDETDNTTLLPTARVRVSERIAEIIRCLTQQPTVTLEEFLAHEHSRFVIVVTFMAVLELWKWDRINVTQDALFGSIILERGARWSTENQETYES
jgi:segregation and condensation protein A